MKCQAKIEILQQQSNASINVKFCDAEGTIAIFDIKYQWNNWLTEVSKTIETMDLIKNKNVIIL